jgi:hypothetical protein
MESYTGTDSVNADLAKCRSKQGHRSMWVIAADNNKKDRLVNVKQVKSLPIFMGC